VENLVPRIRRHSASPSAPAASQGKKTNQRPRIRAQKTHHKKGGLIQKTKQKTIARLRLNRPHELIHQKKQNKRLKHIYITRGSDRINHQARRPERWRWRRSKHPISSPLLSEQESKSKSKSLATHALNRPLLVYIEQRLEGR
jgi:hypothetical protein